MDGFHTASSFMEAFQAPLPYLDARHTSIYARAYRCGLLLLSSSTSGISDPHTHTATHITRLTYRRIAFDLAARNGMRWGKDLSRGFCGLGFTGCVCSTSKYMEFVCAAPAFRLDSLDSRRRSCECLCVCVLCAHSGGGVCVGAGIISADKSAAHQLWVIN